MKMAKKKKKSELNAVVVFAKKYILTCINIVAHLTLEKKPSNFAITKYVANNILY